MFSIDPGEKFYINSDYKLLKKRKRIFLKNSKTRARIEIDHLGRSIFDMSPVSLNEMYRYYREEENKIFSKKLLSYYFYILYKSGILRKKEKIEKIKAKAGKDPGLKISVVIISFNGKKYIKANLRSVLDQSVEPDEIIVVDNKSSDNTIKLIQKFKNKKIKIIQNKKNYHYAKGVNIGVESSSGTIIIILNQDIVLDKKFIEHIVDNYNQRKEKKNIAAIVPKMNFYKLPGFINSIGNFITNRGWGSDNYFCAVDIGQFQSINKVKSSCFGAVAVTRTGWEKVGPLDERFKSYYEDVDWSFRAHLEKMDLITSTDSIAYHDFGGSYTSYFKLKLVFKNRLRFVLKNFSGRIMLGFLKNYLIEDKNHLRLYLKHKNLKGIINLFHAYWDFFFQIPGLVIYKSRGHSAGKDQIDSFFSEIKDRVILSNEYLEPKINIDVIRSYYYFAGNKNG